ncbi:phospholipase D-like domain-containing protein [Chryseobacterium gambrini]|uniref:phospholipase D-like domain-containing protein n=1 Tax=Chryseobacterium gambrini TaxID=373672 RepID=UPI003D0E8CB3
MSKIHFENIDKIIKEQLKLSKYEIKIAVAWITDLSLLRVLADCKARGIKISIIFYNDKINKIDDFEELYNLGADIKFTKNLMHNKFCIIDKKIVINGSYNWTKSAKRNHENIQITESLDVAKKFIDEFHKISLNTNSVVKHFSDNQENFNKFIIQSGGYPQSYPLYYKQELSKELRIEIFGKDSDLIKYVYKYIWDLEDFLYYQKKIFDFFFTDKKTKINLHDLNSNFLETIWYEENPKEKVERRSYKSFLVIDIIDNIEDLNNLSKVKYIEKKIKFTNEKFVFFKNNKKQNFLVIGVSAPIDYVIRNKGIESSIGLGLVKNTRQEINTMDNFDFGLIKIEGNYITNSYIKPYDTLTYSQFSIEHKDFIEIQSFLRDTNLQNIYYQEQINKYKNAEKEKEQKKRILYQQEQKRKKEEQQCYIATMVYQDINHPNIIVLRNFRDSNLKKNILGRLFIKYYYKYSPKFVDTFRDNKKVNSLFKYIIEEIILRLIK